MCSGTVSANAWPRTPTFAAIEKGVEHQKDGVVGHQSAVALHLLGDDLQGLTVECANCDVQRRGRIGDRELGSLGGWLPFAGLPLGEARADIGIHPGRLIEPTIDDDRGVDCQSGNRRSFGGPLFDLTHRRPTERQH